MTLEKAAKHSRVVWPLTVGVRGSEGKPVGASPSVCRVTNTAASCSTSWVASRAARQLNPKTSLKSFAGSVPPFSITQLALKRISFVSRLP